jgi:hypothetical protein
MSGRAQRRINVKLRNMAKSLMGKLLDTKAMFANKGQYLVSDRIGG